LSSALEVLLKELYDKPKNVNASTLRTVASRLISYSSCFKKPRKPTCSIESQSRFWWLTMKSFRGVP